MSLLVSHPVDGGSVIFKMHSAGLLFFVVAVVVCCCFFNGMRTIVSVHDADQVCLP